mgnify:CR=1 FL=1
MPTALFLHTRGVAGRLVAFGLMGLLVLAGCDSGGDGPPPAELEGTYQVTRFELTVAGVDNFNLLADTLQSNDPSLPRVEFLAGSATALLFFQLEGSAGRSVIEGGFSTGPGRVTVDLSNVSEDRRFQLLLPTVVQFSTEEDNTVLQANQEVREVDLNRYAPERYAGLTQPVNGTLAIRLVRQ